MRLKTALSVIGDLRLKHLTPSCNKKLFDADPRDLFFSQGWGDTNTLEQLKNLKGLQHKALPIQIQWSEKVFKSHRERIGEFTSPFDQTLLPQESRKAHIKWFAPVNLDFETPVVVIFAMTGDQGFRLRAKNFSRPLLKKGISTVLLENPLYGSRRPASQRTFIAPTVQDILLMCSAAVDEGRALVQHFKDLGYRRIGVTGVSQGGMLAAVVGATTDFPVAIASSLVPHSPEVIFTEGMLRNLVNWKALGQKNGPESSEKFRDLFRLGRIAELPRPQTPEAAFLLGAKRDFVVPRYSVENVHRAWPGSHIKWLPGTHLTSLALHNRSMRELTVHALQAL